MTNDKESQLIWEAYTSDRNESYMRIYKVNYGFDESDFIVQAESREECHQKFKQFLVDHLGEDDIQEDRIIIQMLRETTPGIYEID